MGNRQSLRIQVGKPQLDILAQCAHWGELFIHPDLQFLYENLNMVLSLQGRCKKSK